MPEKATYEALRQRLRQLEENENSYRLIAQYATDMVSKHDPDGCYLYVTPACFELLGYREHELIGRSAYAFFHPEDLRQIRRSHDTILDREVVATVSYRIRHRQGHYVWVETTSKTIRHPETGQVEAIMAATRDIGERKKIEEALQASEEKYRTIFENAPLGLFRSTLEGRFIELNQVLAQMLGYESPAAAMVQIHDIAQQIYVRPEERRNMISDLVGANGVTRELKHYKRRDGTEFIANVYLKLARDLDGRPLYLDGIVEDITSQKKAEEAVQSAFYQLEARQQIAELFLTSRAEELFHNLLDLLLVEFDSRYGYIGHIDGDGNLVCPSMTREIWLTCNVSEKSIVFPKANWGGLWGRSLLEKRTLLQNGPLTTPSGHISLFNALAVPLLTGGDLVGQVVLANKQGGYDPSDRHKLESLADFIAPVLRIYLEKEAAREQLLVQANKLKEKNIALNVLLENREEQKEKLVSTLISNFERLVYPYFERLRKHQEKKDLMSLLDIVESNMKSILSPVEKELRSGYRSLTPMETQVADLIRVGKTSKEIAGILNIGIRSVFFHRNNIRKKLKIQNTKQNLKTYLTDLR